MPLERLAAELFRLQDLNGNGVLEEVELIKLNEKIAMLHYGHGADRQAVKNKYRNIFRNKLDKDGEPVPYVRFRRYIIDLVRKLDPDVNSQEMILEQFIRETEMARAAFHCPDLLSQSDVPFLANIPFDEDMVFNGPGCAGGEAQPGTLLAVSSVEAPLGEDCGDEAKAEGIAMQCVPTATSDEDENDVSAEALTVPSDLHNGERVEVWSNTLKMWLDGVVVECIEVASHIDGLILPVGSRKIAWRTGFKWVVPNDIPRLVRKFSSATIEISFERGESVEVWSNSAQMWLDAVVQDVYHSACLVGPFLVPPGAVRVSSKIGEKFISAQDACTTIRKRGGEKVPPRTVNLIVEEALLYDLDFQRLVSAVWVSSGYDGEGRLERTHVAAAVQSLAKEIGLDLSGVDPCCLDAALAGVGFLGTEGDALSRDDFASLCQRLLSELRAAL